jgi:trans-aconitate methyltransferase
MSNDATNEQVRAGHRWDAALYERRHSFVWKYGAEVIELLAPQPGERILDLGCGTGQLTAAIAAAGASVVGLDRSPTMIEQAHKNYPELQFVVADAADFAFAEPFDAVFSNAALHWMREPAPVAACVWRALRPGGRFVAEFGGKGNIAAIHGALYHAIAATGSPATRELEPRYFPSIGEYATLLEAQRFTVTYATLFDRPTPLEGGAEGLRNWIAMFANDFLAEIPADKRTDVVRRVEDHLRPTRYLDGTWIADYKRIRVVAFK